MIFGQQIEVGYHVYIYIQIFTGLANISIPKALFRVGDVGYVSDLGVQKTFSKRKRQINFMNENKSPQYIQWIKSFRTLINNMN